MVVRDDGGGGGQDAWVARRVEGWRLWMGMRGGCGVEGGGAGRPLMGGGAQLLGRWRGGGMHVVPPAGCTQSASVRVVVGRMQ